MNTFYGTFGQQHTLRNRYVQFDAEDTQDAHGIMFEHYGSKWAFVYPEAQYDEAIKRFDLRLVPLGTPNARIGDE